MIFWILFCFIISIIISFSVAHFRYRWSLIDKPCERSSHHIPIPKGGGFGILVVLVISAIWWNVPWKLWIPCCIVSLVSFLGDYRDLSYKIRLVVQVFSALIFSGLLMIKNNLQGESIIIFSILIGVSVFFITATANYYNFMDGINGIAGVTGIIAFTCLGIIGFIDGKDIVLSMVAFGVASACMGFLPLNFPKAKVFMGDVGSVLLGFLFASLVLSLSHSIHEFVFLASFLFPFYIDEISTLIIRIKDGDKVIEAHRRHIYQILANQAGMSHTIITIIYGVFQIFVISLIWLVKEKNIIYLISLLALFSTIYFVIGFQIRLKWEGRKTAAYRLSSGEMPRT